MCDSDQIQRILFDDMDIRGVLVGLTDSYQKTLEHHTYPRQIRQLLGEMLAAVSLLSSNLKFEGRLVLQAQGTGAIRVLMAECNQQQDLRSIARFDGVLPEGGFGDLFENGQLAITIEPDQGKRYQGVVSLEGDTLAECLENYFIQSEQLDTRIHLAADDQHAAGFMLQVLPVKGEDEENWNRITQLAATLKDQELLELDNQTLLFRLFHEEPCRLYPPASLRFRCDCSRERSVASLKFLDKEELEEIIQEQGCIHVDCQFCNQRYSFSLADLETEIAEEGRVDPSSGKTLH